MSSPEDLVRAVRPGVVLHRRPSPLPDEVVLAGGGEVFRLPTAPSAVDRHALLVRAMPRLRLLVPVAVPLPRYVGVLDDGATPFPAERRLPGAPLSELPGAAGQSGTGPSGNTPSDRAPSVVALSGIARGQVEGVVAALLDVPAREARSWGVEGPDDGTLLHGALGPGALLVDPRTGLLTGVVDWQPRLGDERDAVSADLAALL